MNREPVEIQQLKDILFSKYKHIFSDQKPTSIETAIEQIVHYYESMINCMPGNVYVFDKNLVPITCNQNVLDMLGYESIEEFKEKTFEMMGIDKRTGKKVKNVKRK